MASLPFICTSALLLLVVVVGHTDARAYMDDEEDLRRSFEAYLRDQEKEEMTRGIKEAFDCKTNGSGCRSVPSCCGELQCYWANGFSLLKDGVCVDCIDAGKACQRSSQCCGNNICDKEDVVHINGVCGPQRTEGKCYKNKQCVNDCQKKWYQYKGRCV